MGSSIVSILVAALAMLSSMVMKLALGASQSMSTEGMSTGGGVAMCTGDEGMTVVMRGEDILSLSASAARTALRYAPRSPTDSYSSVEKFMICEDVWGSSRIVVGEEGNGLFVLSFPFFYRVFGAPSSSGYRR